MRRISLVVSLLSVVALSNWTEAFAPPIITSSFSAAQHNEHETNNIYVSRSSLNHRKNIDDDEAISVNRRRRVLQSVAMLTLSPLVNSFSSRAALAEESAEVAIVAAAPPQVVVPMKSFVDNAKPSLFSIDVPQRFFAIRRSAKGDLPDAKTGQGRRGGTIFTAGDMAKAEVIAVERFPVRAMLEDEGYQPSGDLSTIASLGDPAAVATLLIRRREKDKPGTQNSAVLDRNSVVVSPDTKTMSFTFRQQINVQKPELLMEEMGVSELFRTTLAKATLSSSDGQMMAAFASALDQDFNGPDGLALQKAIDSFMATEQTSN